MGSPSLVSVALFVVGWSCGWFLLWRSRPLPSSPPRVPARPLPARPSTAMIVPARDEEGALPGLLSTVFAQLRDGDECVVVDDESTDATAGAAAASGAVVIPAGPRPEGWTGKAWACATGAGATTADVLVFIDADVRLEHGDVLTRLVDEVAAHPDALVSVQPWHRTGRPVEQLSVFFNITAVMGSVGFTALGDRVTPRLAFGPVLACFRKTYETSGGHGHTSVRGAVAEDIALAALFPSVRLHTGHPDVSFRMYPAGLHALIQGWTKNIASGAASVRWWFGLLIVGWLWSLNGGWITSPWFYAASVVQVALLGRRVGRFGVLTALAYPVLVLFFLVVFLRSVVLTALRRPVRWKGREVASRTTR